MVIDPTIKDNSSSLLESKTCRWHKLSSIAILKHIDLQDSFTTIADIQATFLHPSYGLFPSHLNSTGLSIIFPNLGPSFWHEQFRMNQRFILCHYTDSWHEQPKASVHVCQIYHLHISILSCLCPSLHISLEFVDIDRDQCILLMNGSSNDKNLLSTRQATSPNVFCTTNSFHIIRSTTLTSLSINIFI